MVERERRGMQGREEERKKEGERKEGGGKRDREGEREAERKRAEHLLLFSSFRLQA